MAREDHCCMDDGKKSTCVHYVCIWTSTGMVETEKRAFSEELERIVGLVEVHVMMCITGDFNGNVGTAETGEEKSGDSDREQGIKRVERKTQDNVWKWPA